MKNTATALLIMILTTSFCPTGALPDDLLPPPWRGQVRTTFQHWTFEDDDNPAFPEVIQNAYGDALADISVHPYGAGWGSERLGRYGVWADLVGIVIGIDNVPDQTGYKELWIQVTYYENLSAPPDINVPGGAFLDETTITLETVGPGTWFLKRQIWIIEPNPTSETINITTDPARGMTIDQIVVDTACFGAPPVIINIAHSDSGNVEITWTSEPEATYRVESSTDDYGGTMTWTIEEDNIVSGGTTTDWEDTDIPVSGAKFYRVCAESYGEGLAVYTDTTDNMEFSLAKGGNLNDTDCIGLLDYWIVKSNWLTTNAFADINGDGVVNMDDYNIIADNWSVVGDTE